MLPLKPPYNVLHFINILPSQKNCTFRDIDPFLDQYPIFSIHPNLNFLTSWTQKLKLHKFFPRALSLTQNEPKDPKSILILTMKQVYTYFWKTLPIGDLIWLAVISKSSQIMQPTSNHLKRTFSCQWYDVCGVLVVQFSVDARCLLMKK